MENVLPYHTLLSAEDSSGKRFVLKDKDSILGTLALRRIHGTSATATIGETVLNLNRHHVFKKHVHLTRHGEETGTFRADLLSRGTLTLEGRTYHWVPKNAGWSTWAFEDESGAERLRINMHDRLTHPHGLVESAAELTGYDKELALLGWYLLLLNRQSFGLHMLAAIDLSFAQ
jgi:hypothetical protein